LKQYGNLSLEDIESDDVKFGIQLFDLFSNIDTLKLFLYAEKGITNSKQAMRDLNLTPKRYYSRLKDLINAEILKKEGGVYKYTAFGKALNKIGSYLLLIVRNRDRIKLLSDLLNKDALEPSKILKFVDVIFEDLDESKFILSLITDLKESTKIEKILTYENLVEKLSQDIILAERSIFLASRYLDIRVAEKIIRGIKRGLNVKIIMSKENLRNKLLKFKLILSPGLLKDILEFIASADLNNHVREYDLSYSFCIIDELVCFFEFPKIGEDEFSIAFYISDREVSKKFMKLFYDIWDRAHPALSLEIFKKIL
jgi:predicted transcriptional regulator